MAKRTFAMIGLGTLLSGVALKETHILLRKDLASLDLSVIRMSREMKPIQSREEYLAWVAAWKRLYQQVSDVIRLVKAHRDGTAKGLGDNLWEATRSFRQQDVELLKLYATHLLHMRQVNKILAARSYEHFRRLMEAEAA